jgi:nucleoside-diphosphate-sugar epimerase
LVPRLVEQGHHVTALTRTPTGAERLRQMGAAPVIGDVFSAKQLQEILQEAAPDVVIHQLTAFGSTQGDPLAETIRIRIEGTRNLVTAAANAGAKRFIAQSISFICQPVPSGLTDENSPLYLHSPDAIRPLAESVAELERLTLADNGMEGVVLRYGWFYGPGTNFDLNDVIPTAIRRGRMPIVGEGAGTYSFIHVADAAEATLKALKAQTGIYNIVDDTPAKLSEWLPVAATLLNAPAPASMDACLARQKMGDLLVYVFNEQSGASNSKARRLLDWAPSIPSWRSGFERIYRPADCLR